MDRTVYNLSHCRHTTVYQQGSLNRQEPTLNHKWAPDPKISRSDQLTPPCAYQIPLLIIQPQCTRVHTAAHLKCRQPPKPPTQPVAQLKATHVDWITKAQNNTPPNQTTHRTKRRCTSHTYPACNDYEPLHLAVYGHCCPCKQYLRLGNVLTKRCLLINTSRARCASPFDYRAPDNEGWLQEDRCILKPTFPLVTNQHAVANSKQMCCIQCTPQC